MPRTNRASIDSFLALKRIAFAGVSRNSSHFSRMLMAEFRKRGYEVFPVNPNAGMIDGLTCYPDISSIQPAPEGVMLLTPAAQSAAVVAEAARAGVRRLWIYKAVGSGAVSAPALAVASANAMDVVAGECPFMFFDKPGFPHNLHRVLRSIAGSLPA